MAVAIIGSIAKGLLAGGGKKAAAQAGAQAAGQQMAQKMLSPSKENKGGALVAQPRTQFIPVYADNKQSSTTNSGAIVKTGNAQLDDSIRTVQVSVIDLGSVLKDQEKFKRKQAEDKRKRRIAFMRKLGSGALGLLGLGFGFAKGIASKIPFADRIKKFLTNVLLGSLIGWFTQNFERISEWWKKDVEPILKNLKEWVFDPIWGFVTWLSGPARAMMDELRTLPLIGSSIGKITDMLDDLEALTGSLESDSKDLEGKVRAGKYGSDLPPSERRPTGDGGSMGAIDADTPEARALIKTIRTAEGTAHAKGYDTWFGGRTDMKMTDMTLQEVYDEQTRRLNSGEATYNGLTSAAVGVGQFMNPLEQARAMYAARGEKFDPTKIKFDEKLQNDLLLDLAARKRGIDPNKELTKADFDILQMEWAGLGTYHGQTKRTTADSLRMYRGFLGSEGSDTPPTQRRPVGDLPPLPSSTAPGQQFGASRSRGARRHAGQDFDINGPNATFPSQIGGVVTHIGYDPAPYGYGHYADIYNEELNVTERIAEGAQLMVKKGDRVAPGQVVAKGETYTGVIHYEIRPGKETTFGYNTAIDPVEFLKNKKRTEGVSESVSSGTSYSQPQKEFVFVPIQASPPPQPTPTSKTLSGPSARDRLNSLNMSNQIGALFGS